MSVRLLSLVVLASVWFCAWAVPPQTNPNTITSDGQIWFAVQGNFGLQAAIVPIFKVEGSTVCGVPEGCGDTPEARYGEFEKKYLIRGRRYPVQFGGAAAGYIQIEEADPEFGTAYAKYHGRAPLGGRILGLATTRINKAKLRSSRKRPTATQETAAVELAKSLFEKSGLKVSTLPKIQIINLTVTRLTPANQEIFIGSFKAEGKDGLVHGLFFIATLVQSVLTPEFVWAHVAQSESDGETMAFVDQADLFADGREEIVTEITYYENWSYVVLRRANGKHGWETFFETATLGCE